MSGFSLQELRKLIMPSQRLLANIKCALNSETNTSSFTLCDDVNGDGSVYVEFIRHIVYASDGSIDRTYDTTPGLDADYVVVGTVGVCSSSGAGGGPTILVKTADETRVNNVVFTLDTDLQSTLEANSTYYFYMFLLTQSHTTPDTKIKFKIPVSSSINWSAGSSSVVNDVNSINTILGATGVLKSLTAFGIINTTDTGTFGLEWAQSLPSAEATIVKKGSVIQLTKIL